MSEELTLDEIWEQRQKATSVETKEEKPEVKSFKNRGHPENRRKLKKLSRKLEALVERDKLNPRERIFVEEYIRDFDQRRAFLETGFKYNHERDILRHTRKLLNRPYIRVAVEAALAKRVERTRIAADKTLQQMAFVAHNDPADAFDIDGKIRPIREIPEPCRAAIKSMKIRRVNCEEEIIDIQFIDKVEPLIKIGQHQGLFLNKSELNVKGKIELEHSINVLPISEMDLSLDMKKQLLEALRATKEKKLAIEMKPASSQEVLTNSQNKQALVQQLESLVLGEQKQGQEQPSEWIPEDDYS